ncbi:hypothetical protein BST81_24170 [Leptolyngbya sp. 'hensonii']|uniref:YdcF family protein n=1 Tax=Leptolyngbya sp. 'hensonii' TaxID=1922337 RepID=UPI00094F5732|nr:ElyC/SanA/YdcF family protein [Leptolyngbya sp. 'hensonii']OLP15822.1 hypothetical protein BST81_24170 [Leptolyngbya sp. 'hensonii']
MFELLSQILLALLIIWIIWFALSKFVGQLFYTVLGVLVFAAVILLAVLSPSNDGTAADIWQILSLPLKPLGLSLVLILSAILQGLPIVQQKSLFKDSKFIGFNLDLTKAAPQRILIATLIVLISSLPIVADELTERMEKESLSVTSRSATLTGTIILLGQETIKIAQGANVIPDTPQIQLLDNRLPYTAQLYGEQAARGNRSQVIICGDRRQNGVLSAVNSDAIARQLVRRGVAEGDIISSKTITTRTIIESNESKPTSRQEAYCEATSLLTSANTVKSILTDRGLGTQVILVTHALNTYRAVKTFENKGLAVIARPTDFFSVGVTPDRLLRKLIPSAGALAQTTRVTDEWLASLYYFIRNR